MPGFDGTGPQGAGPFTGGGRGYCVGYGNGYYGQPGQGRGLGRGFRRGFGRGLGRAAFFPGNAYDTVNMPAGQETDMLKNQAALIQKELEAVNKRISELEALH